MSGESNVAGAISPATSAAASAGGSILSSVVNSVHDYGIMEAQNDYNIKNWERQNEYNLPKNQYARYMAAGASPEAAMQAVLGIENSAGSVGSVQPGHPSAPLDLLSNYFKSQNLMLDKRLNDAEVAVKEAEKDYYNSLTNRNNTLTPLEADRLVAEAKKFTADANLSDAQKDMQNFLLDKSKRFEKKELEELQARINELNSRSDANRASALLSREKATTEQYIRQNLAADAYYKQRLAFKTDAETDNIEYQNRLLGFKEIIREFYHADPDAPIYEQFLEASAKGEEGAIAIWNSLTQFADDAILNLEKVTSKHQSLAGWYMFNRFLDRNIDRAYKITGSIGNIMPFTGGSAITPSSVPRGLKPHTVNGYTYYW